MGMGYLDHRNGNGVIIDHRNGNGLIRSHEYERMY